MCCLVQNPASDFKDAFRWILSPTQDTVQYDYLMTARIRLLLFRVGADDVGGGYIRRSRSTIDPDVRLTQVLFGSDPAKAPRRINYWGAATEALNGRSSALLGFMKAARSGSSSEAEADMRRQKDQGKHSFEAILSIVHNDRAVSRVVRPFADTDFSLHQLSRVQELSIRHLNEEVSVKELQGTDLKCPIARGFLQAIDELNEYALNSGTVPRSLCYVYNARNYTLTLEGRTKVSSKNIRIQPRNRPRIDRTYRDLIETRFSVFNHKSGERSSFQLLLGTQSGLRGVPVQIVHQPNWWFQVVLNLSLATQ